MRVQFLSTLNPEFFNSSSQNHKAEIKIVTKKFAATALYRCRFANRKVLQAQTIANSTKETLARNLRHKFSESEEKITFFGSIIVPELKDKNFDTKDALKISNFS